jgi:F0F1-type ATP synthase delta subunit
MASDPLVESYAEALFQIARSEETLDRVEEELTRLNKSLDSNAELREFLGNPQISSEGKKSALFQIFGGKSLRSPSLDQHGGRSGGRGGCR